MQTSLCLETFQCNFVGFLLLLMLPFPHPILFYFVSFPLREEEEKTRGK